MERVECINVNNNFYISIDILAIGPDGDIYCNICCKQINWPGQYVVPWDTSLIQVTIL